MTGTLFRNTGTPTVPAERNTRAPLRGVFRPTVPARQL